MHLYFNMPQGVIGYNVNPYGNKMWTPWYQDVEEICWHCPPVSQDHLHLFAYPVSEEYTSTKLAFGYKLIWDTSTSAFDTRLVPEQVWDKSIQDTRWCNKCGGSKFVAQSGWYPYHTWFKFCFGLFTRTKLEEICDLGPFPSTILQALVKQGINSPHKLINTFGRGIGNLAKQIVYMKLSLFIEEYPNITRRLFAVSRAILGFSFHIETIFPNKWAKAKKTEAYDATFNSMQHMEIKELQFLSLDSQFDTDIMMMFNKLKTTAVEITNPQNNTNIFDITFNASQKYEHDDSSTIKSNQSTPAIIPSTVSLP